MTAALRALLSEAIDAPEEAVERALAALRAADTAGVDVIPVAEAAQRLGKSKAAMRSWAHRNGLARRDGGRLFVVADALQRFVRDQ